MTPYTIWILSFTLLCKQSFADVQGNGVLKNYVRFRGELTLDNSRDCKSNNM